MTLFAWLYPAEDPVCPHDPQPVAPQALEEGSQGQVRSVASTPPLVCEIDGIGRLVNTIVADEPFTQQED
jgi:hypothetical protein